MRIVLAITGASGIIYGLRLAQALKGHELFVIVSKGAREVARYEGVKIPKFGKEFDESDLSAPIASGSYKFDGMIVAPCSMKTLAGIAHGYSDNLVVRAADVAIKERRKLVLVPRETPLSPIHLENMLKLSRIGVDILPACPGFYHNPKKVGDLVDFVVGKALDRLGIENELFKRWGK